VNLIAWLWVVLLPLLPFVGDNANVEWVGLWSKDGTMADAKPMQGSVVWWRDSDADRWISCDLDEKGRCDATIDAELVTPWVMIPWDDDADCRPAQVCENGPCNMGVLEPSYEHIRNVVLWTGDGCTVATEKP